MSAWSSTYRGRAAYVSDSDPDSDTDANANATAKPVESNDARLIREMDLSRRHETVEYRPNPWSIARINAVSRPCPPKPAPARTPGPAPLPLKPQPIVEAFKKQAQRGEHQPVVRDVSKFRVDSIGGDDATKWGAELAQKARQGCESAQNFVQTERQNGHTWQAEPLAKPKSAHIATVSDHVIQSAHAARPFKIGGVLGTHRAAMSSPVRLTAPVGHAVGNRPTFHHSSPGPGPTSAHITRPPLPSPVSAPPRMDGRPTKTSGNLLSASPTAPSWLLNALNEGIRDVSPPPSRPLPMVPELRQDATPPHIRTPKPTRKRLASPEPTLPRKTPRPPSAPRRCPTAYAFGEGDDPDAEWSTLARTKRKTTASAKRAGKPSGVRQSGGFRLPLLGLARAIPTPMRALEVKPRVITYLPPPMTSKKVADDVKIGGLLAAGSVKHRVDEAIVEATIDPLRSDPAKRVQADAEAQEEEEEIEEIRVMDSDVTLVNEDEDEVAKIDLDDVCARYPTTRAYMKAANRVRRVLGCVVEVQV